MALSDKDIPASQISVPALNAKAITPADSDLETHTRGIYVGGTGDVTVMMAGDLGDSIVTFKAVPVGVVIPVVAKQIRTTLTTATLLVALF